MKKVKSLFIASLVISFLCLGFGIYQLINNEYLFGVGFLFGGITIGWNDWKTFLTKKKL